MIGAARNLLKSISYKARENLGTINISYRTFARSQRPTPSTCRGGREGALERISALDSATISDNHSTGVKGSGLLRTTLKKEDNSVLDIASQGALDSTAEDILEILNDALESPKLRKAFPGFRKSSDFVEIVEVVCNRDYSHTTAYWLSVQMTGFINSLKENKRFEEAQKYEKMMKDSIDTTLRAKEGAMRSFLLKKMEGGKTEREWE